MQKITYTLFLFLFIVATLINTMEVPPNNAQSSTQFYSIRLPGQNGGGGTTFENTGIINTQANYSTIATLSSWRVDLGQGNCVRDFNTKLQEECKQQAINFTKQKLLLFGVSQGTATLVNWLAQMPKKEQKEKVGCLFLEAVLGSGNNAILHTASMLPFVTSLPFARTWLPLIGKFLFPTYNPFGTSAFKSALKISKKIPIIIMHAIHDPQLSINDARELYCILKDNDHPVYLFENNCGRAHFDTLDQLSPYSIKESTRASLQKIYQTHNLPYNEEMLTQAQPINLLTYQPSVKQVRKKIHSNSSTPLRNKVDFASGAFLIAGLCTYLYKKGFFEALYSYIK